MSHDTPDPTAPRPPLPSSRRRPDVEDPLALFPTETEAEATRVTEARVRLSRERARKAKEAQALRMRRRRRRLLVAALIVLATAAAGATAWFAVPNLAGEVGARLRRAVSDPPSTLVIETTPAGWEVSDGSRVLGTTPVRVELPAGTHALTLRRGETTRPLEVTLSPGAHVVHHLDMVEPPPAPTVGTLRVTTDPPGAAVAFDGILRGRSPLTLPGLRPGEHTVVVANAYRKVAQQVTIAAGETLTLLVALGQAVAPPVSPGGAGAPLPDSRQP